MTLANLRRLARLAPIAAAFTVVAGTGVQPVSAVQCTQELGRCYQEAAGIDGFWARTAYALDCELTFAQCAREAVFG